MISQLLNEPYMKNFPEFIWRNVSPEKFEPRYVGYALYKTIYKAYNNEPVDPILVNDTIIDSKESFKAAFNEYILEIESYVLNDLAASLAHIEIRVSSQNGWTKILGKTFLNDAETVSEMNCYVSDRDLEVLIMYEILLNEAIIFEQYRGLR